MKMATARLGNSLANLNLQDSTELSLNVLTANIGKANTGITVEMQKLILENFFHENQPDCILIQENPWPEDNIKEHLKVIDENYNIIFFDSCEIPDPSQPLTQSWIYRVIRGILIGNKLYSRHVGTAVLEIYNVIRSLEVALDAKTTTFDNGCTKLTVSWKSLSQRICGDVNGTDTALVCIFQETTFAFVHFNECVLLLDTHSHGSTGALVAIVSQDNAGRLISWYKDFNKFDDSELVQVRRVQYSSTRLAVAAATLFCGCQ